MAETNAIICRATLQGEIKANATLGVPVEVYVDREIYDGETVITPTEDDITLETAGKAVLDDILIHGVPTDPNVYEGEFIGTETGVLTIDTGYEGDGFPKAIIIQPVSGVMQSNDGFFDLNPYAMNTFLGVKANGNTPTYDGTGIDNVLRTAYTYRSTNRSYASNQVAQYPYDANPAFKGGCVRINNSNTVTVWIDNITDSGTSRNYFAVGIRYKYQIFY